MSADSVAISARRLPIGRRRLFSFAVGLLVGVLAAAVVWVVADVRQAIRRAMDDELG